MTKRIYLALMVVLLAVSGLFAQNPEVKIGNVTSGPGEILVPLEMLNFTNNVNSFTFKINVNSSLLQFDELTNKTGFTEPNYQAYQNGNLLSIVYYDMGAGYQPNGKIFDMKFTYTGAANTTLAFGSGNEVTAGIWPIANITYTNGTVTTTMPVPDPVVKIGDVVTAPGAVQVPVEMLNFTDNINSLTFKIDVPADLVQFVSLSNTYAGFASGTFMYNHTGDVLNIQWQTTGSGFLPTGHVFDITLNYLGGFNTELLWLPGSEVTYTALPVPSVSFIKGSITQIAPVGTIQIGSASASIGDGVSLPLTFNGSGLNEVSAFTLFLKYDKTRLTYLGYTDAFDAGIQANHTLSEGLIAFAWNGAATDLSNAEILKLNFAYLGPDATQIEFIPGCEVNNALVLPLAVTYGNGFVNPVASTKKIEIADTQAFPGEAVIVPIQATDLGTVGAIDLTIQFDNTKLTLVEYSFDQLNGQWTTNAGLNNVSFKWQSNDGATITDGNVINMKFVYHGGGTAALNFVPVTAVTGTNGLPVNVNFVNGVVTSSSGNMTATIGTVHNCDQNTAVVPVTLANLSNVTSFTFPITFDGNVLTFVELADKNPLLTGIEINFNANGVKIEWHSTTPVDLNGKLFDMVFDYQGMVTAVNFAPDSEITGDNGLLLPVTFVNGLVDCNIDYRVLTLSHTGNGSIVVKEGNNVLNPDVAGGNTYTVFYGKVLTLEATGDEGWEFANWEGSVNNLNTAVTTINMINDFAVNAVFTMIDYTLSLDADPVVGGSVNGAGIYHFGDQVNIDALPNTGYAFVNWTDGNGTVIATTPSHSFSMPSSDYSLTAHFALIDYTLSLVANPVEGGTVSGDGVYHYGDQVVINAVANTGYAFVNWTDANNTVVATTASYTVDMPASDYSLTANFVLIDYNLTLTASPVAGGTVTGNGTYHYGDQVNINAVANTGYDFVNWKDAGGTVVATTPAHTLSMPANDLSLTAYFQLRSYTITVAANPTNGGTVSGGGTYDHGSNVTVNAVPASGWEFVNWTDGNGAVVSTTDSYSFTATQNLALTANFNLVYVASFPFSENFDAVTFPPLGWNVFDVDNGPVVKTWARTTSQNHTIGGTASAYHVYGPASQTEDGWLVTPKIPLPAGIDIELSFWSYIAYPTYYGKNSVLISTNSNNPISGDFTEIWTVASVTTPWVETVVDLSAYAGQEVFIAFRYQGSDAHSWYLDDVAVYEKILNPTLAVTPTSLTETHFVPPSQETTQVVTLSNTGGSDLTWELTVNTGSRSFVANTPEDYARLRSREQADGLVVIGAKGGQGGGSSSHQTRDAIIRHDNGVNDDAIGLTSGGTFHVAARFPASFMGQYSGMKLNQVEVYINDVPSPFVLKVYGQGTATSPGTILYQQTLVPQGSSWNLITLDTPVDITGQDLWIGYTVTHAGGQYPAGCDAGPHVTDGDWISTDGTSWSPLNTLAAIDVNWNIAGYLIPGVTYAKDVGVHSLVSPASGANLGDEQVIVKVKNYGTEPQSNISVSYTFNGGSPVTATIPGPLAGGATLDYTFAGTVNLGTPGQSYTIQACATVTGDENTGNDCKTFTVTHVVPVYCDATTGTQDEYISRVQLGTIDNSSGWQGGVADYTDQYTEMAAGSSGEITVTNGNPWSSDKVTVWVDWNKDYTFETGGNEQFVLVTTNSAATFTGTIAVPAGTPDGLYRMRIRMTYSTAPLPCGNASYGEVEDYSIKVTGGAPPTPWLSADVTSGTIPAGGSTQITVTFNSASLSVGSYTGSLDITSNDPVNSSVSIPVTLNVEESDVCYPSPRNLTGTSQNQNVTLTWQVPDFTGGGGGGGGQTEDFYEGFEAGTIPTGWTVYDVDGDTYNWENTAVNYSGFTAHTGLYCMTSASYVNYVGPLTPNNWLVTPGIKVTANSELKFWVSGQDPNYAAEKYYVKVSTTGNTPADFGSAIFTGVATGSYEEKVVNLSSYAGQTIYIAFQHTDVTDQFYLNLDDVTVTNTETRSAYTVPVTAGISQAIPFRTSGMSETEINAKLHPEFVYVYGESSETTQPGGTVVAVAGGIKHMSGSGTRELLYDNGPFVNSPGTGPNGTDQSVLQNSSLGMTTYGAGVQFSAGNRMADDFVVTDPWEVESFTFYTYQTGSTTTSTITGAYVQVWNGDPTSGGQVVWGDLTTNVMSSTAWTNAYRMSETDAGTTRPVMSVTCATPGLTLQPGTYWVDFTLAGSLSSGPWAPPITITGQSTTGNSKQYTSTGWGDFVDGGTSTAQGVPFLVEGTISGGGDECPHGELLGYNVYRGNQKIGETVPSVRTYIDSNVTPGTYVYGVTAVYGEPYPGESDPVTTSVTVSPAATFPFEEDWTSGNFTANNWTFDPSQGNWGMNSTTGNPAPSARFGWSPSTTNYSYSLISKDIAANLAVSNVTLQFDIMLDNYTNTGAEQIKVYIWNGSSWVLLETIANTGDIPWTTKSYDVTAQALGKTTKVRFEATGANTFDIDYWYLDNIKVFEGQPAQNPVITVTPAALQYWVPLGGSKTQPLTIGNTGQGPLNWTANIQYLTRLMEPEQVPGGPKYNPGVLELSKAGAQPAGAPTTDTRGTVVLHYDGDNDDAIGLTSGGSFHVAARFPSDMVAQYSGYVLQSVDVYINDVPNPSTLYIWGAGSANAPGAVLHQQNFTGTAASWNTITLSTPLTLTGQDIWVGYSVTHAASEYPAGCDAGPANPNGDWISTDGSTWAHLAGYGLDYNWNIRALISGSSYSWLTLSSSSGTVAAGGSQNLTTTANSTGLGAGAYYANILISSNDPVTPVKTVPAELHVGVGIEEDQMSSISVYPVPATQVLNIKLVGGVKSLRVLNYMGQVVDEVSVEGMSDYRYDVSRMATGAYTLQFINQSGSYYNKTVLIGR